MLPAGAFEASPRCTGNSSSAEDPTLVPTSYGRGDFRYHGLVLL